MQKNVSDLIVRRNERQGHLLVHQNPKFFRSAFLCRISKVKKKIAKKTKKNTKENTTKTTITKNKETHHRCSCTLHYSSMICQSVVESTNIS